MATSLCKRLTAAMWSVWVMAVVVNLLHVAVVESQTPQPTVLTDLNFSAVGATIYFRSEVYWDTNLSNRAKDACSSFQNYTNYLTSMAPDADLVAAIGFSASIWQEWGSFLPMPKGLFDFPGYTGPNGWPTMEATGGDIFVHGKALRRDVLYTLVEMLVNEMGWDIVEDIEVIESWRLFVDSQNRDLTGYVDGTVNCPHDQKVQWGLIGEEDKDHINGSYAIAQRWVHNLRAFFSMNETQQDNVFGRTKKDSIALPNPRPTAHFKRVEQSLFGYFIVRQAQPWGDMVNGNHGLFFIAYSKDAHNFDPMCKSMVGWGTSATPEGDVDEIMKFSQAVRSNFWYFPSLEVLDMIY